ncbi:MAG TPA: short chain dehydrogenase [Burkholderiales bacterium]|nr:short chain dehydrogenase [Burkholderiales bacterium]
MKVIVVGASGTIGSAVVQALNGRHEIIKVGKINGDYKVDISDFNQIKEMFEQIGSFDALVSAVGDVHFGVLQEFNANRWAIGLNSKLMGQVNLVMSSLDFINDGGSFTLTSGILSHDPIRYGCAASMVNNAIDGFVRSASIEMTRGVRINVVSPTILKESMDKYGDFFNGFIPVAANDVAQSYIKSIDGHQTGQVYRAGW